MKRICGERRHAQSRTVELWESSAVNQCGSPESRDSDDAVANHVATDGRLQESQRLAGPCLTFQVRVCILQSTIQSMFSHGSSFQFAAFDSWCILCSRSLPVWACLIFWEQREPPKLSKSSNTNNFLENNYPKSVAL